MGKNNRNINISDYWNIYRISNWSSSFIVSFWNMNTYRIKTRVEAESTYIIEADTEDQARFLANLDRSRPIEQSPVNTEIIISLALLGKTNDKEN